MKRVYADLHLCPNLGSRNRVEYMVRNASELGYSLVAMPLPGDSSGEKVQQLRDICRENRLDFVSRVDLQPKTSKELIKNLRKLRRRFEVIAVMCRSKQVARQAAKDRRVDLVNFNSHDPRKRFFDEAEAQLASHALGSLEIDVRPLLTLEGRARIKLLSCLRREVAIAEDFQIPIVLSSGASHGLLMRKPREMAALASLFDLDKASSIEAVSESPVTIVERNRGKLNPDFVAPGVRVVRRGEDC